MEGPARGKRLIPESGIVVRSGCWHESFGQWTSHQRRAVSEGGSGRSSACCHKLWRLHLLWKTWQWLPTVCPRRPRRYDTYSLLRPDDISRKWNNHKNYVDNVQSLGKLLLLARRLCEAGCGFVTVTTNFVWDMHADVNNVGVEEGMGYMGVPLDHAISAFIEDLYQRGLEDRIMLIACGDDGTYATNQRARRPRSLGWSGSSANH